MTEQNLGKDFETLLGLLRPEESVTKDDIKVLKEQIFGPNVFWVTETRATDDILDGGIVVCLQLLLCCCLCCTICWCVLQSLFCMCLSASLL